MADGNMHGIIYRHIGRTGLGWIDGQKSPVFRRGKSGNPSPRANKASLVVGFGVKAFCCISGTIHLCTSDIMDRSMIYDIRVLQDTFWYQKKLKITLKIFLFSNFITSYQKTMTFTSGLFVVKSFVAVCFDNSCEQCARIHTN